MTKMCKTQESIKLGLHKECALTTAMEKRMVKTIKCVYTLYVQFE